MKIKVSKNDIVYIDMDGVLVQSGETKQVWNAHKYDQYFFLQKEPVAKAIDAFNFLAQRCNVYILSTPAWNNVYCWSEKRMWVEKHLGTPAEKKLILTHEKSLNKGFLLIDDSLDHGASQFEGVHIHFGTDQFPGWQQVLDALIFEDNNGIMVNPEVH